MNSYRTLLFSFVVLALRAYPIIAQDKPQSCYQVGDTIASDIFVCDLTGEKKRLLDLKDADTKLIYLLLFGGPSVEPASSYGGLWCVDSFNDMPVSNYVYLKYKKQGVAVIAVACPPVYGEEEYGYMDGTFLAQPETAQVWKDEFGRFVNAAYELQGNHVIPFDKVYFDPKFRLAFNHKKHANGAAFSESVLPWMGKFKPATDHQNYSVPVIWLLSPEGKVLHEPFVGNRYGTSTQRINYTVREVEAAVQKILAERK
ncbi:MAG: hypothetical protein ACREOO_19855 [bacterium]